MYEAVIFDLDGVVVRTDGLHCAAWTALARRLGLPFDGAVYHRMRGISRMASLEILLEGGTGTFTEAEKEALAQEKNDHYRALLARMGPGDVDPQVRDTLAALRGRGIKLALASSSRNARDILRCTGLTGAFDAIVDGGDIRRAKPDPEVFLKAAEALGTAPSKALVVEDAQSGILAAHAGGFGCASFGGDAGESPFCDYKLDRMEELLLIV